MYIWRNNGKEQGSEVAERDAACARLEVILMIDCILKAWIIGIRKKKVKESRTCWVFKTTSAPRGEFTTCHIGGTDTRTRAYREIQRRDETEGGANIEKNILFL